ncbi:unnamed protein product [Amoebophrya sp. A120]|nr:unnamed protein product [Amoebophrya sp. A120]|eukprot:GSA120T00002344001.1
MGEPVIIFVEQVEDKTWVEDEPTSFLCCHSQDALARERAEELRFQPFGDIDPDCDDNVTAFDSPASVHQNSLRKRVSATSVFVPDSPGADHSKLANGAASSGSGSGTTTSAVDRARISTGKIEIPVGDMEIGPQKRRGRVSDVSTIGGPIVPAHISSRAEPSTPAGRTGTTKPGRSSLSSATASSHQFVRMRLVGRGSDVVDKNQETAGPYHTWDPRRTGRYLTWYSGRQLQKPSRLQNDAPDNGTAKSNLFVEVEVCKAAKRSGRSNNTAVGVGRSAAAAVVTGATSSSPGEQAVEVLASARIALGDLNANSQTFSLISEESRRTAKTSQEVLGAAAGRAASSSEVGARSLDQTPTTTALEEAPATVFESLLYAFSPSRKGKSEPRAGASDEESKNSTGTTIASTPVRSKQPRAEDAKNGTSDANHAASSSSTSDCRGAAAGEMEIRLRLVSSASVPKRKTVYLIRHGESLWNEAQDNGLFWRMPSLFDAPLSQAGKHQCEHLQKIVDREFGKEQAVDVFCSPLTRAMQTAWIGLGVERISRLVLLPSAREKKNSVASVDSQGIAVGEDVVTVLEGEMRALLTSSGEEGKATTPAAMLRREAMDLRQVQEQWWTDWSESSADLEARLQDFAFQLALCNELLVDDLEDPATRCVNKPPTPVAKDTKPPLPLLVVGHSHYFRELFRKFLNPLSTSTDGPAAKVHADLKKLKLSNAGMCKVDLVYDASTGETSIDFIELCGDTQLVGDVGPFARLGCTAIGAQQQTLDKTAEIVV